MGIIPVTEMTRSAQESWEEVYRYAAENSPYYREVFPPSRTTPPLYGLPLLEKEVLCERAQDFLCVPPSKVVEIVTTSGTTGQPLVWMLSDADLKRLATNERLSFECAGLTANDAVLVAVAMDRCFIAGLAYWLGLRDLGCSVARVGPAAPALVLDMIQR